VGKPEEPEKKDKYEKADVGKVIEEKKWSMGNPDLSWERLMFLPPRR
jgi:hypothetical protein